MYILQLFRQSINSQILMFKEPVYGKIIPGHVIMAEKVANEEHNNLI